MAAEVEAVPLLGEGWTMVVEGEEEAGVEVGAAGAEPAGGKKVGAATWEEVEVEGWWGP